MSKLIDIRFDASPTVEQTIEILTDEDSQEFMEKIKSGEYVTTMSYHPDYPDNSDKDIAEVIEVPTFNLVGVVKRSENVEGTTEYINFRFAHEDDEKIDI